MNNFQNPLINMEEKWHISFRKAVVKGFIITMAAAVLVPVMVDILLVPLLEDVLLERRLLLLSGPLLVTVVLWSIVLILMMKMSGTQILRKYGTSGVLGLILAYWYLGNIWGAAVPILSIIAVLLFTNRDRVMDWFKG